MMTDSSAIGIASGEGIEPSAKPQKLTRNVISALTRGLDASDVMECYALVRYAPLHGLANSTISIQKMAFGVRYRLSGAAAQQHKDKRPLELTLEYGPQRLGPDLSHEAMPYVQDLDLEASFIGFENVGQVYYTTKIVTEQYQSSYYMASMTGAVLNKILLQSVKYAERRKRYQPLTLYSVERGLEMRSSSSHDFTRYVWKRLAHLGVEIEPILPPPSYEARLWIDSWEKVVPEPAIANQAASFYLKLYQCLESIATGDYSAYMPTAEPTIAPMPTHLPTISSEGTQNPTLADLNNPLWENRNSNSTDSVGMPLDDPIPFDNSTKSGDRTDPETRNPAESSGQGPELSGNEGIPGEAIPNLGDDKQHTRDSPDDSGRSALRTRRRDEDNEAEDGEKNGEDDDAFLTDDFADDDEEAQNSITPTVVKPPESSSQLPTPPIASISPTATPSPTAPISPSPTDPEQDTGKDAQKAQQAAQDAQEAADEAKNSAQTEGEAKTANAAQAAANAAKAAADATSNAAAQAAMDNLLSGDGSMMSSIVTTCFTNPQYGIASIDENGTKTVPAFLYKDGSNYYKLNLTSPYLEVVKLNRNLPKAYNPSEFGSGGDLVDWVLALFVLSSIFLLVVVSLQQMGYQLFSSLFRCQRWFFNPRKYDYEGNTMDNSEDSFDFGQDSIPVSMGGVAARGSPIVARSPRLSFTADPPLSELQLPDFPPRSGKTPSGSTPMRIRAGSGSRSRVELEMSNLSGRRVRTLKRGISDTESQGSMSDNEMEVDGAIVPERLYRDPDLVEMPYLKSTSKVAIPVGGKSGSLRSFGYGSDGSN